MTRKTLERGDFRLLHYAGEVTYCVVGKRKHTSQTMLYSLTSKPIFNFFLADSFMTVNVFGVFVGFLDKNNDLLYRNIKDVRLQLQT